jgi:hypothetical protein
MEKGAGMVSLLVGVALRARRIAGIAVAGSLLVSGCASETLFQSGFNQNAIGSPPPAAQAVGTVTLAGAPGSIVIVGPPPGVSEHWVQISRNGQNAPVTSMLCNFSQFRGEGTYSLIAALFIPRSAGLATVEFDTTPMGQPSGVGFLHLDFLENNTVRINDDPNQVWGTFPRDQVFSLTVTLEITSQSATAHMSLFGTGASGNKDFNVTPVALARQIGAVRFFMGTPWQGSFEATDILVTRKK